VLQHVITRDRLRGHIGLNFCYHTLRAAGLGMIMSLRYIQVHELITLTRVIAVVDATSRDFVGEPAWDGQPAPTPALQDAGTWGVGCTI
jgi:hypothetical protein